MKLVPSPASASKPLQNQTVVHFFFLHSGIQTKRSNFADTESLWTACACKGSHAPSLCSIQHQSRLRGAEQPRAHSHGATSDGP